MHENGVVLMNKQGDPVGTRIIGPVPKLLRKKKFQYCKSLFSQGPRSMSFHKNLY